MPKLLDVSLLTVPVLLLATAAPTEVRAQSPTVALEAGYVGEVSANMAGGLRRGMVGAGNLDLTARVDGGSLVGAEGLSAFVYGLATHGGNVTELTGDAQAASNIEAPQRIRLYEAWVQQNVEAWRLSFLAGFYDVNSEFDVIEEAGLFINSSFGIGAEFGTSGANGPSIFPVTSLGFRVQWHPTHRWYAQAALLDGVPGDPTTPDVADLHLSREEGALWVTEFGYLHHRESESEVGPIELGRDHVHPGLAWRVAVGAWQYTRDADLIAMPGTRRAHPGGYLLVETFPALWRRGATEGPGLFFRVGFADDRTHRFGAYTGAGLTYTGLLPGRPDDRLGVGLAVAHNGSAYDASLRADGVPTAGRETALELTYEASIAPWIGIQPDLQYIRAPDADPAIPDALLLSLRTTISF